ncbi:MAG: GNAT family N-acetyltransferase, partial [Oscillospiraceae bacterium]|nr:GNAT family N-acetyltransferase [Oscillospiraceae bacterium]
RTYNPTDWPAIESVHDQARVLELKLAGLEDAFLPLRIAAEREGLLDYPGLFVAELDEEIVGFSACSEEELAWLYVSPAHMRQGIGRRLSEYALQQFPEIRCIEVLKGTEPARKLYESLGFTTVSIESGRMPGNESFMVEVYSMKKRIKTI